jgi:DNA polymerase-3 subunit alpha
MSEPRCVHLHCHSEYSSLDGGSRVSDMPAKLKELGMEAMALTDHGVMQGIPDF